MKLRIWEKGGAKAKAGTVVIIGPGWALILYLAEHLVRSGFKVMILQDAAEPFPRALPHWVQSVDAEKFGTPAFASQIEALNADPEIHWILPITEDAIIACRHALGGSRKVYPRLSARQFDLIQDKHRMADFARSVGLPVPKFTRVSSARAATNAAEELGYPVVVKGNGGRGGQQVAISQSAEDVVAGYVRLAHDSPVLSQYIDGNTWAAGGFFVDGQPLRMHIYECVECLPRKTSPAIEIRHAAPPELEREFRALFAALRWNGFGSADFIAGPDGLFYFIEMNPRLWGGVTSALAAGNKVLDPLVATLNGLAPERQLDNKNGAESFAFPGRMNLAVVDPSRLKLIMDVFSGKSLRGIPGRQYWKSNLYYLSLIFIRFIRRVGGPVKDVLLRRSYQK